MAEIAKMSPSQLKGFGTEALTLINKLQNGDNMKKLELAFGVSKDSIGAVDKEWAMFRATFDERMKDSSRGVMDLASSVGKPMMDIVSSFLTTVDPILSKLKKWVDGNKELVKTILKVTFGVGAFLFVAGVLALVVGVTSAALAALSPLLLVITGRFGLLSAASWLVNTALLANPVVWVVIGVMALIAAIGTLIYYLDDVSAWLWSLWDRFMMFSGLGELLSPVGDFFIGLAAPIIEIIGLVDQFMQKLDVFEGVKSAVSGFTGSVSSMIGLGDDSQIKVDNVNKNHSIIDVNIVAPDGVTTESTAHSSTGGVTLRTIDNGIG
jgi:hypothetical protein